MLQINPFLDCTLYSGIVVHIGRNNHVAANGDEIEFGPDDPGMVITGPGPSGIMSGEVVLKPGTGRFTNCSGVITTTGIFDMGNDYAKWIAVGTITY
jgi:hypothetical protein